MVNLISFLVMLAVPVTSYWMVARAEDENRAANGVVHRFGAAAFARTRP